MKHKSYDAFRDETHYDNFDIDFIRYTRAPNVAFNNIGTAIMMFTLLSSDAIWKFFMGMSLGLLIALILLGGTSFFMLLFMIAKKAGASGAIRLAGRRGLFSLTAMTLILVFFLLASGRVTPTTLFGDTLVMVFSAQIFCALLAVPLDYCSTIFFFKRP